MKIETIYGKYTLGGGSCINDKKLFNDIENENVLHDFKTMLMYDIRRLGLSKNDLYKFKILDVGSGRQAYAFHMLGAKLVHHYDLSLYNVNRLNKIIEHWNLPNKLTSKHVDLVEYKLPKKFYDLVYLNGVVHHFSDVGIGLKNCMQSVKKNGYLWLYFYRSGTFRRFVFYMIRDLIKNYADINEYFISWIILFNKNCENSFITSVMMDNLFVEYQYLYSPGYYRRMVENNGFEIFNSSKAKDEKDIDFTAHGTCIFMCKRTVLKDIVYIPNLLSPKNSINQLNKDMYSNTKIIDIIDSYYRLRDCLSYGDDIKTITMAIAFNLFNFAYNNLVVEVSIKELNSLLDKFNDILLSTIKLFKGEGK